MKIKDNKVWDTVRERWLVLTPEEWVRQHIIEHLTRDLLIEPHRIAREVPTGDGKRADITVYDRQGKAILIIECKAQRVPITTQVFEQVAQYNIAMGVVEYLAVTNGRQLYCCRFDPESRSYKFIEKIPKL